DGDHDEELNQRECPANLRGAHALGLLTGEPMTGCGATRDSRREKGAGRLPGAGPPVRVSRHLHGILMDGEGASNNFLHRVPFFLWTVFPPDPRQTRYLGWVASLFPWTQTERWKDFRANQKRCPRAAKKGRPVEGLDCGSADPPSVSIVLFYSRKAQS